jgi:hypothetical protein
MLVVPFRQASGSDLTRMNTYGSGKELMPEEFKVFPNPVVSKKFTIEFFTQTIAEIRISNIAGQTVYIKKCTVPEQRVEVLTGDFPDGIYLLRMTSGSGSSRTIKLLINTAK